MAIFQIDLTKLECISKEEKEFILFNILLEISEELENFDLEQLNIKQTEILQILFQIIKPEILVPSRIIRNQLGRCFQIFFSRSNSISIFSAFNILLENILLPKIEDYDLHIKWTSLIVLKHIYIASENKLSIHLNDTINAASKIFKISNNIIELRESCFETLSVALNSCKSIIDESKTKKIFKFIKLGLSDKTYIIKLKALMCFKELLKICVPISGCTDIYTIKNITTKFINNPVLSVHDQAAKVLAIALITNSTLNTKDSNFLSEESKEIQSNDSTENEVLPTSPKKYIYSNSNSKNKYIFYLKYISDIYAKHITDPHIERFIISIYLEFLEHFEREWILSHYKFFIKNHIFDIASSINNIKDKQKISTTRNIICRFLSILRKKLDEESQFRALKILNEEYISIWLDKLGFTQAKKVVLTSILSEISRFILTLSNIINTIRESLRDNLLFILNCTSLTIQKYASWCIKCFAITIPNDITYLMIFCLKHIKEFISADINNIDYLLKLRIRGYALALSRLISIGKQNPLYISSDIFSEIFLISCSILKLIINNPIHTILIHVQIAWTLISSLMKLGSSFVRGHLSELFLLWKDTLLNPSINNLPSETNQLETLFLLYTREYALGSIFSFLLHNKELLTTNVLKKISFMLNETNAVLILFSKRQKNSVFLDDNVQLSQEMLENMIHKRILQCYLLIIWKNPEDNTQSELISRLITIFAGPYVTIAKNTLNYQSYYLNSSQNIDGISSFIHLQSFSNYQEICKINNIVLQNYIYVPKDYALINIKNNSNFDSQKNNSLQVYDILSSFDEIPWNQLSIYIEIIDLSILLFGIIFLNQSNKIKESILEQLITFITLSSNIKPFQEKIAVICNSNLAVLGILRFIENNINQINNLKNTRAIDLMEQIAKHGTNSQNPAIKRISCETIGRLTCLQKKQLLPSIKFYIRKIIELNNSDIRSGSALCLGRILNHYKIKVPSSYISKILDILQSLSIDQNSEVCFWALESIAIGIQSFGPSMSSYCLNILNVISKIYNRMDYNINNISITISNLSLRFQILCNLTKCLNAIVNIFGPDLQKNTEAKKLVSVLIKGLLLENNEEVLAEAIYCAQHILLFSSDLLNPYLFVKLLQTNMMSKNKNLARASVKSLYQLMQHDTLSVFKWGENDLDACIWLAYDSNPEIEELKNIIEIWLYHTSDSLQNYWIHLCLKTFERKSSNKIIQKNNKNINRNLKNEESIFKIDENYNSNNIQEKLKRLRWKTQKLILQCINNLLLSMEFYFKKYSSSQISQKILSMSSNISNLIKIGFMASTGKNYHIRFEGLKIIQKIIKIFSPFKDPDFPTLSLLEQYEAQLVSAIIPSFSSDSIPEIAVFAMHICSYFLTSEILKEIPKTGRIIKLLSSALLDINNSKNTISIGDLECSDNSRILLKLSIISVWAELQIASEHKTCLSFIIKPNLALLIPLWITSLRDYTKFCFGTYELSNNLSYLTSQSINFDKIFSNINNDELFEICNKFWINVVYAISILLESNKNIIFKSITWYESNNLNIMKLDKKTNHKKKTSTLFFLLFGICFEALLHSISNKRVINTDKQKLYILSALEKILNISLHNEIIYSDTTFSELVILLKRLLLTEQPIIQILIIRIATSLVNNYPLENQKHLKNNKNYSDQQKNMPNYPSKLHELSEIIILPLILYFQHTNTIINDLKAHEHISNLIIYSLESYIKIIKKFPLIIQYDFYDCTFFIILKLYYNENSYHLIPKILPLVKVLCEDILTISKINRKSYQISQNLIENILDQITRVIQDLPKAWEYGLPLATIIMTITGQILSPKSKSFQKYYSLFTKSPTNDEAKILIHCMKSLLTSFSYMKRYILQSILFASFNIIKKAHLDFKKSAMFDMGTNACNIIIDLIKNISGDNQQYIAMVTIMPILIRFTSNEQLKSSHKKEISFKLLSLMACFSKNFHQVLKKIPKKDSDMLKDLFKYTCSSMPISPETESKFFKKINMN